MTGQELKELLKTNEQFVGGDEFMWDDYDVNAYPEDVRELVGEAETAEHFGGEGQGDTYYTVVKFPKHGVYLKFNGWYSSYDGADFNGWDDVEIVEPKERLITVYECVA